jgi:ABC-type amino acid transport system permease subunit
MNAITMLRTAVAVLTIAALGGIVMAIVRLSGNRNPPSWLAMLHGLLAAAGLTLILYASFTAGVPLLANIGVILLVLAALGGVVLNQNYQWKAVLLPRGLMIGHALCAVAGFVLIVVAACAGSG